MAQARTGAVNDIVDLIISAGPNAGEAWAEVSLAVQDARSAVGHLHTAGLLITGRAADEPREAVALTADETAKIDELQAKLDEIGDSGRRGLLSDLFAFIKANPEVLQFLLLFLKK